MRGEQIAPFFLFSLELQTGFGCPARDWYKAVMAGPRCLVLQVWLRQPNADWEDDDATQEQYSDEDSGFKAPFLGGEGPHERGLERSGSQEGARAERSYEDDENKQGALAANGAIGGEVPAAGGAMQLAARGRGGTRNSSGDGKAPSAGTRYQALPGLVSTSSPEKDQGRRKRAGADLWPDSAGSGLAADATVPKRHRSSNPGSLVRACSEVNRAPRDGGVPQQQRLSAELAQARDDIKRLQVAPILEHLALHSWLLCSLLCIAGCCAA
jgi:hypothetical protein